MSDTLYAALVEAGVQPDKAKIVIDELAPSLAIGRKIIRQLEEAIASSQRALETTKRTFRLLIFACAMQGILIAMHIVQFTAAWHTHEALVELREQIGQLHRAGQ